MLTTVLIGPHFDLHPGIHGSMKADPPKGFTFHQRGARHHFIMDEGEAQTTDLAPFDRPHLGEFIDFGPGPQPVHTARWPVVGRRSWVTDMDDFGYPLLLGRYAIHAAHMGDGKDPWSADGSDLARRRAANMLAAYAHPSCKAVLFRTRFALRTAESWLRALDLEDQGKQFLAKCRVVYPAQKPLLLPARVEAKWDGDRPTNVLFVGNAYEAKNGRLALKLFRRLREEIPGVRFTYVGMVPERDRPLTEGIDYRGSLPRAEVLDLLRESHVLFHPSKAESFGMVLIEAAASAMAVVAARGPGMEHVDEVLTEDSAMLVDRESVSDGEEEAAFSRCLGAVLTTPGRARTMGLASYELATAGRFSLGHRNRQLAEIYGRAESEPADEGFDLEEIPFPAISRLALLSDEVQARQRAFREAEGITAVNFYVEASGFSSRSSPSPASP